MGTGVSSPRTTARIAGALNLFVILAGLFAEAGALGRIVVSGDPAATARNIPALEGLFRIGLAIEVLYLLCSVPLKLLLCELLRVVDRRTALLMLAFGLTGTAIECVSVLAQYAALLLVGSEASPSVFDPAQIAAFVDLALGLFHSGFVLALAFLGAFCLALGRLIARSTFLPLVLGWLVVLQGSLYLLHSVARIVSPPVGARIGPWLVASEIGEVGLCLWLLVVGVDVPRWETMAAQGRAPSADRA